MTIKRFGSVWTNGRLQEVIRRTQCVASCVASPIARGGGATSPEILVGLHVGFSGDSSRRLSWKRPYIATPVQKGCK